MSKVGLILGAGPSVSSYFYYRLNKLCREQFGFQPELIMYNLSFSTEVENNFISKQSKLETYETSLKNAVDFLLANQINQIAFPCFSLSPILEDICAKKSVEIINPFDAFSVKSSDAIISVADIRRMFKVNGVSTIDFRYVDIYSIGLEKAIKEIINGTNPINFASQLEKIENNLSNEGIKRLIIACTELCMIEYKNKINKINLLDVLIKKTLDVIRINNFG